jgi:hypothetical protein
MATEVSRRQSLVKPAMRRLVPPRSTPTVNFAMKMSLGWAWLGRRGPLSARVHRRALYALVG